MQYPTSKLPNLGTTIFTEMSKMASDHQAINLSQGFPDFNGPPALLEGVGHHINKGANQYPPMIGIQPLREAIAAKITRHYGATVSADNEITITSGATEAIYSAITSVVEAGDEVIVLDPAFDCYVPAIELNGGVSVHIQLQPPLFTIDWSTISAAITPRTKLIILNSPHNPTGATYSAKDISALKDIVAGTDILLLSDDVYEHITYDNQQHHSFVSEPELFQRSFIVSSFGKTYHATGWKVGYCVAPAALSAEFRKVHQFVVFTTSTPFQWAIADYMKLDPEYGKTLGGFYQQKRDLFCESMASSRFTFTPSRGTYFQLMDYSAMSDMDDIEFCHWLTKEVGVAAIPISVFCQQPLEAKLVRFCFAKNDETLLEASDLLRQL
jgi:methionine aminotransferase